MNTVFSCESRNEFQPAKGRRVGGSFIVVGNHQTLHSGVVSHAMIRVHSKASSFQGARSFISHLEANAGIL